MDAPNGKLTSYIPPEVIEYPGKWLVAEGASGPGDIFLFFNRLEIGRFHEKRRLPGMLLVNDPTVSSRHCVITQEADGRCYVRDTSRNGTRVDGRRLTPNLQTELELGQVLSVGRSLKLRLDGRPPSLFGAEAPESATHGIAESNIVTVLVGDIRNYTSLVRLTDPAQLQESVNRVFARLEAEVQTHGGTLKEFQGDALFAFWEKRSNGCHATKACRAALHLEKTVRRLAADPSVWGIAGFPLQMDFALATGLVTISGYGSDGALSLSMVGESVVLAFRIEKFANQKTGPIIVCPITRQIADGKFKFNDLGRHRLKGFDEEQALYGLVKEKR
jgi:class 3 adenylate cyclase